MKSLLKVMKSDLIGRTMFSATLALFAAGSLPLPAAEKAPVSTVATITPTEAKELIATANTAGDHMKLAQYFHQQAAVYEAEALDHDAMIVGYKKNAVMFSRNTLEGGRAIGHCQYLAKSNRGMAKAVEEMAVAHEGMAKHAK